MFTYNPLEHIHLLLTFLVTPQITPFDFGEQPINFGDSSSLTCSVHKGDLPINLSWLHNNISIGYMDGIVISKVGQKSIFLNIDSVTDKHAGKYTCIAKNKAGVDFYAAVLNVNGIFIVTIFTVTVLIFKIYQFPFYSFSIVDFFY